jgi:exodeoxyribonuclease V alpha subunit
MKRFQKWQKLNRYFEQGVFTFIDLAFAESVLKKLNSEKEEHAAILVVLFALCRQGHLTLDLSEAGLCFVFQLLSVVDTDALKELLHLGTATFPLQGIAEVEHFNDHPHAWICRMGTYYYLQKNWVYESKILKHIERLNRHTPVIPLYPNWGITLPQREPRLNKAQTQAIENAIVNSLSLITGGPGTGKTFTAAELVKICLNSTSTDNREQMRIILTAPTGKAVSQLEGNLKSILGSEAAIRAGTLHAMLGIKTQIDEEEEMHPLFADLIIVDECSMIDAKIFSQLLSRVPNGARLVLIGDKDQLPPVEAGSIFADLLEANVYPSVSLSECLRSDCSEILTLSHHIKQGNASSAFELLNQGATLFWIDLGKSEKTSAQLCADLWEQYHERFLYSNQGINYYSQKPLPEQIYSSLWRFGLLSSIRKGDLGVDAINRYFLHQSIKKIPQGSWAVFPIMITRNNYELQAYNGDLGFLVRKLTPGFSLRQFELDDYILLCDRKSGLRQIAALNLSSFEYSYCISVHKSQGSEYDEVVIVIPPGSESFGREVLYTAVTRARHKVTLICSQDLFLKACAMSSRKISGLRSRICNSIPKQLEESV